MKILHAYLFFSIKFAGGTSDLMYKIAKAQEKQGVNPAILSGNYKFDEELASELTLTRFYKVPSFFDAQGFSLMPSLMGVLVKNRGDIDIVHMHVYRTFQNIVLYVFCKLYRIPYVVDAHGAVPLYTKKNKLKRVFDKLIGNKILKDAAYLIAETEIGVKEYLDVVPTLDTNRLVVISPPFDTDEFEVLPERNMFREKFGISSHQKLIMFLGRVHHIKGNDCLIQGFAKLCEQRDDVVLAIVGSDDGHMDECKSLASALGVEERVLFTGFIGGSEKNEALVDADIVVQMSRQEQGAWAPFEAVLCGTPIIVSEHTGAGEDVKRVKAGVTVPFGQDEELANALNRILNDYSSALDVTQAARQFILEKMSMNARAHEYTDLYAKCLEQKD